MAFVLPQLLALFVLFGTGGDELPSGISGLLNPQIALEVLGKDAAGDKLEVLIAGPGAAPAGGAEAAKRAVERAIENLASASALVREKARETLLDAGESARKRLEEVAKSDPRRAEEARKVLAELDAKGKLRAHEADLARIFAIRLAVERGRKDLLPLIRKQLESENLFVRLAAEDAVARLEGKEVPEGKERPRSRFSALEGRGLKVLEALPEDTTLVLAVRAELPSPGSKNVVTLEKYFQSMLGAGLPLPPDALEEFSREAARAIVGFLKSYGDMRPERFFLVQAGKVSEQQGNMAFLAEGFYERAVLENGLRNGDEPWSRSEVAGFPVYSYEPGPGARLMRLVLLDDHAVLFMPPGMSDGFALEAYLRALRSGEKPLRKSERWNRFLTALEAGKDRARGLFLMNEELRRFLLPVLERELPGEDALTGAVRAGKEVEITVVNAASGKTRVRAEALFSEGEPARKLEGYIKGKIEEGIRELEATKAEAPFPALTKVIDNMITILKETKVSAEGTRLIVRNELEPLKLETLFGTLGTTRVERVEAAK